MGSVNIIDEDISAPECERLRAYGIHFRQIGAAIGRLGMKDREDILPRPLGSGLPTASALNTMGQAKRICLY